MTVVENIQLVREVEAELERVRKVRASLLPYELHYRATLIDIEIRRAERALDTCLSTDLILACAGLRDVK